MRDKILWLSILGLALARPPNPIDSTASNFGEQPRQRTSRSIWPFTSSATTTEEPENYPPELPDNNAWLPQGVTAIPHIVDFNKYPVWQVHKYTGIDLQPINLQPENTYPPELHHVVDTGYSSGSSSSSDFPQNNYQNGYQDFGTYPTGHPTVYSSYPATYPAEQETHNTGEFLSTSFTPGTNPFSIQTQQKHEVYAPPHPLTDFRSPAGPVVPAPPQTPQASYGLPNTYHVESIKDHQGHKQEGQAQVSSTGEQQSQSSYGGKPDLSFLDDLGGLAPFLPDPTGNEESVQEEETEAPELGFFEKLFSRFRGSTETPAADEMIAENEKPVQSGGFLSSVFGIRSDTESPEVESSATESSGGLFSSLFYPTETEKPAVVLPTTYYLPKPRGPYITITVPKNVASSFAPSIGPYVDHSNIAFHEPPKVFFTQREDPRISSPTLGSGNPYNPGYSDVSNSGLPDSAINSDYQSSIGYGQALPSMSKIVPQFTQDQDNYQPSDFGAENFSSNQGDALNGPHVEYLLSANNDQQNGAPTSSKQPSSETKYYQGQRNSQDLRTSGKHQASSTVPIPQSGYELPQSNLNTMTSPNADDVDQSQNEKQNQNLSTNEYQHQSFDTTNFNYRDMSNTQEAFDHNRESLSLGQTINENEPIPATHTSSGFTPSLAYGLPIGAGDQLSFRTNSQENSQQTSVTSENNAYDHSLGNIGDTVAQDFDGSSTPSHERVPPKRTEPAQSSVPVYQTPISALQNPSNTPETTDYRGNDFRGTTSDQEADDRFIKNLSALTSYGTPTNSYNSNSFMAASSNIRSIAVPAPTKDEVNDGMNLNTKQNIYRSVLPEELSTKKVDRVNRKVMKRKNLVESSHSRRSTPERQAPTEEADTSLIVRNEKDSIPEVTGSRQFDEARVSDGYSKVQHGQHQVVTDTA